MKSNSWFVSRAKYGKQLIDSGIEGAREARKVALGEHTTGEVLSDSARDALKWSLAGLGVGILCSLAGSKRNRGGRMVALGVLGGMVGFGAGMAWETRLVTEGMAQGALRNINAARDQHWLEKNPVSYG